MSASELWLLGVYYTLLGWLVLYSIHRFHLIRLIRNRPPQPAPPPPPDRWPAVTIQLPVYNEPAVIRRLIRAAVALDYPGSREIQILDDSNDQTTSIIRDELARMDSGVGVVHIRRDSRAGFKAGALAYGMSCSSSDLFAVFDADFVPQRDFLLRTVPWFSDSKTGMVQARWGHLNREESLLTRLQAIYLDAHFAVESSARHAHGLFFNFNGTAGVWRREAIEDAGGWSAATVTEDLDLSYRAQMSGWNFRFLEEVDVPAELPNTLTAFHGQQFRWAKGSLQTARLRLPRIMRASLPWPVRVEALVHLTNNISYLLTLLLALLLVPSMMIRYAAGMSWILALDVILFASSSSSLVFFYREGQRRIHRPPPRLREILWLIPFGVGLSVTNARAVIEGLTRRGGEFNRTPKQGQAGRRIIESIPRFPLAELILSAYLAFTLALTVGEGLWIPSPFIVLFLAGYGSAAILAMRERIAHGAPRESAPDAIAEPG